MRTPYLKCSKCTFTILHLRTSSLTQDIVNRIGWTFNEDNQLHVLGDACCADVHHQAEKNDNKVKAILLSFLSKQPVCAQDKLVLRWKLDLHEWTGILLYYHHNAMCKFCEQSHDVSSGQVELECLHSWSIAQCLNVHCMQHSKVWLHPNI